MALVPWGRILLCGSLRSNCHKLKTRGGGGGPKAQGLFVPPSSVDFSSCFSWPKDDTHRDADGGRGRRENGEVRTRWGREKLSWRNGASGPAI